MPSIPLFGIYANIVGTDQTTQTLRLNILYTVFPFKYHNIYWLIRMLGLDIATVQADLNLPLKRTRKRVVSLEMENISPQWFLPLT